MGNSERRFGISLSRAGLHNPYYSNSHNGLLRKSTGIAMPRNKHWGQLIDNLITLTPIFDYNNQIVDRLQTG
jgi:hypothetical protein